MNPRTKPESVPLKGGVLIAYVFLGIVLFVIAYGYTVLL